MTSSANTSVDLQFPIFHLSNLTSLYLFYQLCPILLSYNSPYKLALQFIMATILNFAKRNKNNPFYLH